MRDRISRGRRETTLDLNRFVSKDVSALRRSMAARSLILIAAGAISLLPLRGATLTIGVHRANGAAVRDAVVYAIPEGKESLPARTSAVMDQKNRTFVPRVLAIQTGTTVSFPNNDDVQHQVYSFSSAKLFQLPLYKGTPAQRIVFDK